MLRSGAQFVIDGAGTTAQTAAQQDTIHCIYIAPGARQGCCIPGCVVQFPFETILLL